LAVTTTSTYLELDTIYRYDAGTTNFSANLAGSAVLDYFDDSAEVGDILYFRAPVNGLQHKPNMQRIRFNVGTQLVADAITVVWEYKERLGNWSQVWSAMPNISDGTDAFQNAGTNYVTWDIPSHVDRAVTYRGWDKSVTINGNQGFWIRCRITAVTNLTEGGANATDEIANWDGKATVTADTADLDDVYDQMITDGLSGFVYRSPDKRTYDFKCFVDIASGATLADIMKTINFSTGFYFRCLTGGTLTLGETSDGRGYDGCVYTTCNLPRSVMSNAFEGTCNFYGCMLNWTGHRASFTLKAGCELKDCFLNSVEEIFFYSGADMSNINIRTAGNSVSQSGGTGTWENINRLKACQWQFSSSVPMTGLSTQSDSTAQMRFWGSYNGVLINPSLYPGWSVYNRKNLPITFTLKYTLDLKVVDATGTGIEGASVAITDVNGDAITDSPFATDANGDITAPDIIYQYGANAVIGTLEMENFTPHTVTITKASFKTKVVKLTMDRRREEIETLEQVLNLNFSKRVKMRTQ